LTVSKGLIVVFEPVPENDFSDFIRTYFQECKKVIPKLQTIVGKWNFEDLIPGMSDFDTRFIFSDDMEIEDWISMSEEVGKVHLMLCKKHPEWARKLEHTPGINLTWKEMADRRFYYPEFLQWSSYFGDTDSFELLRDELIGRGWSEKDEIYHLKKFFIYYGPYNRGIDPAVNLGRFESKYPLHSRMMHYFLPPLQSGLSIIRKKTLRGKLETLRAAGEMMPQLKSVNRILHALEHHYEVPLLYQDPFLANLEKEMENDLRILFQEMIGCISCIPRNKFTDAESCKKELAGISDDHAMQIFSGLRFSRTMKGRLYFYTEVGKQFDSSWLIENELNRIGNNFLVLPLTRYWLLRGQKEENDIPLIIESLRGDVFDTEDVNNLMRFHSLTMNKSEEKEQRKTALEILAVFNGFYRSINKIVVDAGRWI